MNTEQMRAYYEKWVRQFDCGRTDEDFARDPVYPEYYDEVDIQRGWAACQAALASQAKSVPEADEAAPQQADKVRELEARIDALMLRLVDAFLQQTDKVRELEARIDALMFEYCPDEMTEEQIANYATYQKPVDASRGERNEGL